ncbi:Deoxyguanosinetriphosphate triphosphohydrolase [Mycetocola reblochoni REB411]|uniref:Deoxyguanosinetriphosphate triphosphohydrolase n=1 Tax=Mycetocola reblochoni REB411 TaxID=1255698 RepID=A0A1R4K4T8_9MICO|nr:deoxyguanosinetriphosphate triphosphohydrolase [Mycetocola reblochoni]SJN39085.1 Deoxyguanosinetriphosphate triphosphohydrolase [Mycetocola reblochoni REB411]
MEGSQRWSGYRDRDEERWLPEEHSSRRSDFARDRARLLHSSALRRLAAKTQVLSPTAGVDFARNRLTHSLEVAQIGRELAERLALDPDVVDTACLAHDLGHPPFGHNGERALNEWSLAIGGFEGNAQTLRILSRTEPKVLGPDGRSYGLNLTRASLDASCKYPWPQSEGVPDPGGRQKFGFFDDDREAFLWLRDGAPERRPCIEAQVMDLSDDIAYSVHDFEDAIVNEYIDPAFLSARAGHHSLIDAIVRWAGDEFGSDEIAEAFERLAGEELWLRRWSGSFAELAQLKNFTSQMIGRFSSGAMRATRAAYPEESLARFGADLIVPSSIRAEIAVLKGVVANFVMASDQRQPIYRRQRELLLGLAEAIWAGGDAALDAVHRARWLGAADDAARRRIVVDQVASLTDQSALAWHARLVEGDVLATGAY